MKSIHLAVVALAATASAAPAFADRLSRHDVPVAYGDLNLDNAADAQTLVGRLEVAASASCKSWETVIPRFTSNCAERSIRKAVKAFNNPVVESAYVASLRGNKLLGG